LHTDIAVVLGTRPEIIKLARVIALLGPATRLIHTGQHYDDALSRVFLDAFQLPEPEIYLGIGGNSRGEQIAAGVGSLTAHLSGHRPSAVVVQGDTNTTLAAGLAANSLELPLVHIEAGLRSFDRRMPEEHNRVLTDHLSDLLCAPTQVSRANLLAEGIPESRVVVTGNTVVEALTLLIPDDPQPILAEHQVKPGEFVLATFHRPENVDTITNLRQILGELARLPLPVLLPLHPRTAANIRKFELDEVAARLMVIPPIDYPSFLGLAAACAFLVSDSGGVQEEASVLKRPVLVVRNSTERPEVVGTFAELVQPGPAIGKVAGRWLTDLAGLHARLADIPTPYGDGTAARRSVEAIQAMLK